MDAAPGAGSSGKPSGAHNLTRGTVLADDLEIADTLWSRFMGLMGRTALPAGRGLWLTGNGIHMFFMRFPIDAVFLDRENRVLRVVAHLAPATARMVPRTAHPSWGGCGSERWVRLDVSVEPSGSHQTPC